MKRTLRWFFSVVIMLAVAVPAFSAQGVSSQSNKSKVFSYLTEEIGFNTAAACGIMANIEHESGFDSSRVLYDTNGLLSGGLCMWNGSRFSNLQRYCNRNGYNYLGIPGQLSYLEYELDSNYYGHIYDYLKSVPNTSSGAYDAAYYWCYYFEVPANRSYQANRRGNAAATRYWDEFSPANAAPKTPTLKSSSNGKTLDSSSSVKLSWTSGGEGATKYIVSLAKYKNGKYDFSSAKTYSTTDRKLTLKLSKLSLGKYAVRVQSVNGKTGEKSSKSNTVKFKSDCLKHNYVLTSSKEPTFKKAGRNVYKCTKCSNKKVKNLSVLTVETFSKRTVSGFTLADATKDSVKLKWNSVSGADGYQLYMKQDGAWKKIATLKGTKYTVKKLKSASTYLFAVRAYIEKDKALHVGKFSYFKAPTSPMKILFMSSARTGVGQFKLTWNRVNGADGYTVFVSTDANGKFKALKNLSASENTYTAKKLKSGKTYYFVVKAYKKSDGAKAYSEPTSVRTAVIL